MFADQFASLARATYNKPVSPAAEQAEAPAVGCPDVCVAAMVREDGEVYAFFWNTGERSRLLEHIARLAINPGLSFDLRDAEKIAEMAEMYE